VQGTSTPHLKVIPLRVRCVALYH